MRRTEGTLLGVFNNGAYGQVGAVEDLTSDVLRRQLEVNVIGAHELARRLVPAMRKNGAGRIVQCSSVLGLVSAPYRGAYCASKHSAMTRSPATMPCTPSPTRSSPKRAPGFPGVETHRGCT